MLVVGGVLIGAAIAATLVWRRRPSPAVPVTRFALNLPQGQQLNLTSRSRSHVAGRHSPRLCSKWPAVSPVHVGARIQRITRNWTGDKPGVLSRRPFGGVLGDSMLKRIAVDSAGTAITICEVGPAPSGISWSDAGIVFSRLGTGIMRVSPNGGKPEVLLDMSKSDDAGRWSSVPARRPHAAFHGREASRRCHRSMGDSADRRAVAGDGRAQDTHRGWKRCAVRPDRTHRVRIGREQCSRCRSTSRN